MADISWQDLKALGESLQKKRSELQQMWREQGDREAYWRRELDAVRDSLDETRRALDERDTTVAELEGELVSLREQLDDAQAGGASSAEVLELQENLAATQTHLDELLQTNTQLQADLQQVHEELAELRGQIDEGTAGGGDAGSAALQEQIDALEADKQQMMEAIEVMQEALGGEGGDGQQTTLALAESQQQVHLLEQRLATLAEVNPDAVLVAELSDERDILQEELGAWLDLADSPDSLKSYLAQMESDLETARRQVTEAQAGLGAEDAAAPEELAAAMAQVETLQSQLEALQADFDAETARLTGEAAAAAEQTTADQDQLTTLTNEMEALQTALVAEQANVTALQDELTALQSAQGDLTALQESLAAVETELTAVRESEAAAEIARTEMATEAEHQAAELATERERVAELQAELATLQAEHELASGQVAELAELQSQVSTLQAEITRLQSEHEQAVQQVAELTPLAEQVSELQAEIARLQTEHEQASGQVSELSDMVAEAGATHEALTEAQTKLGELEAAIAAAAALQARITTLETAAAAAAVQAEALTTAEAKVTALEAEITRMHTAMAEVVELETDVRHAQVEATEIEFETQELHDEIERLQSSLSAAQSQLSAAGGAMAEVMSLQAEIDRLQQAGPAGDPGVVHALEAEVARLSEAHARAAEEVLSLQAEQVHATEQLSELQRIETLVAARDAEIATLRAGHQSQADSDDAAALAAAELAALRQTVAQTSQLRSDLERLRQEQTVLAQQAAASAAELQAAHQELHSVKQERLDPHYLAAEQRRADLLHEELDTLRSAHAALSAQLAAGQASASAETDLRQEVAQARGERDALQVLLDNQRLDLAALQADLAVMQQESATNQQAIWEAERQALAGERDRLASEAHARVPELNALRAAHDDLYQRLQHTEAFLTAAHAARDVATSERANVDAELDRLRHDLQKAHLTAGEMAGLRAQLESLQQVIQEIRAENDSLRQAAANAGGLDPEITARLADLQAQAMNLALDLGQVKGENEQLTRSLDAMRDQAIESQQELVGLRQRASQPAADTGELTALEEALRTLQVAQQQEAATAERLATERDTLAAEVATLRQQHAAGGEQDPAYWQERAEAFEAKYQELYWQKALAAQEKTETAGVQPPEDVALLKAELEQLQVSAHQTQSEMDQLQRQLAEANRRSPDMDLSQVAMLGEPGSDANSEGLSKAIAKQLGRVSRSLAKLGISRTGAGEATPTPTESTLWILGSADRGRQWADELSGYLNEYGLSLIWISDPSRLPQPWVGSGLVLFSDEPGSEPWGVTAKERQIPVLMMEPTNLIRLKIAILDRFIRK